MPNFLESREFWIAVLTGGGFVKVVDYLFPFLLNRKRRGINLTASEKDDLRKDIKFLRGQIDELRAEVDNLKDSLYAREREVSLWQRRYWKKKIELEKVVWQVRNFGDEGMHERVFDSLSSGTGDQEEPDGKEEV